MSTALRIRCAHCKNSHGSVAEVRQCADPNRQPSPAPVPQNTRVVASQTFKEVAAKVPAGRYAIEDEKKQATFWQIDKPDQGRWKGYTFVKMLIGAPGNYRQIRPSASTTYDVLDHLAHDPRAASILFGKLSRTCGRCNSPLTREESRERGIGPDCAKKMGW